MKHIMKTVFLVTICVAMPLQALNSADASLFKAVQNGDIETVKRLSTSVNINARDATTEGLTPLAYAIRSATIDIVKVLIAAGASTVLVAVGQLPRNALQFAQDELSKERNDGWKNSVMHYPAYNQKILKRQAIVDYLKTNPQPANQTPQPVNQASTNSLSKYGQSLSVQKLNAMPR